MSRWYRAYEGTVTDAKLGEVALVAGCSRSVAIAAWHCLLESAAGCNAGGLFDVTPRRVAVILGEQPALIEAVFSELMALGMIGDGKITAWSKRQYESDSSTERSRKSRERSKAVAATPCNGGATLQQQHATPPDTEADTETELPNPLARDAQDWQVVETKCRQAAGWEREPNPMLAVIGPIIGLIDAGCDLELDVLPTIKAKAHMCRGSKTWKYFIGAIQQARDDRLGAMTAPKPSTHNGTPRHATYSKPNTIASSFAEIDAIIERRERELAALEASP